MSSGLQVPHERALREVVKVLEGRGESLIYCVGASRALRRQVEDALEERLGAAARVARGEVPADAMPWAFIAALAGEGAVASRRVVSVGFAASPHPDLAQMQALNLGREARFSGGYSVLLWVGGPDAYDLFARHAPDLWVHRAMVGFFLTRDDLAPPDVTDEAASSTVGDELAQIRRVEERALLDPLTETMAHLERCRLEEMRGDATAARHAAEAAQRALAKVTDSNPMRLQLESLELMQRLSSARQSGLVGRAIDVGEHALARVRDGSAAHLSDAMTELAEALRVRWRFAESIKVADETRERARTDPEGRLNGAYDALLAARSFLDLGALAQVEQRLQIAQAGAATALSGFHSAESRRADIHARIALLRGELARARGQLTEGIRIVSVAANTATTAGLRGWAEALRIEGARQLAMLGNQTDALGVITSENRSLPEFRDSSALLPTLCAIAGRGARAGVVAAMNRAVEHTERSLRERGDGVLRVGQRVALAGLFWRGLARVEVERRTQHRKRALVILRDAMREADALDALDLRFLVREELGALCAAMQKHRDAARYYAWCLHRARQGWGPSTCAELCLALGRIEHAERRYDDALRWYAEAGVEYERDAPEHRARYVFSHWMQARAAALGVKGDLAGAIDSLGAARVALEREGARVELLDVLHAMAGVAPAEGSRDHRREVARAELELARESMMPLAEATAMLDLATLRIEEGSAPPSLLEEAGWIASALGDDTLARRVDALRDVAAGTRASLKGALRNSAGDPKPG